MLMFSIHFSSSRWIYKGIYKYSQRDYVRGSVFLGSELLKSSDIPFQLPPIGSTPDQWQSALLKLNGFFSVVRQEENRMIAAVDRVRSIPLFYGVIDNSAFLSDDAEWVRQKVGDSEMERCACEEFQLTGYVTGKATLYSNVKQVQAGEMLVVKKQDDEKLHIQTHRYYRFLHTEPKNYSESLLSEKLDNVAEASVQRLIEYANGRQIVIPLSGGYDSRLIATLLRRLNYENVLTVSYGVPGNRESTYSYQVANSLGYPWHFVEYSNEKWKDAWEAEGEKYYQFWASGWSSWPLVQDWLAVRELNSQAIVDPDCVFVPGHTGDFISGGHIPRSIVPGKTASKEKLAQEIIYAHFSISPWKSVTERNAAFWQQRICERAEVDVIQTTEDLANFFEKWEWQERQSKFIVNSIRAYEFWSYDWWLPLWDNEFILFWEQVPLTLRLGKKWYTNYVKLTYSRQCNHTSGKNLTNASDKGKLRSVLFFMVKFMLPRILMQQLESIIISQQISQHPLALFGRYPKEDTYKLVRKGYRLNGVNAYFFLKNSQILGENPMK